MAGVSAADGRTLSFVGTGSVEVARLARLLDANAVLVSPDPPNAATWDWDWTDSLRAWRAEIELLPTADQVVICTWPPVAPAVRLVDLSPSQWRRDVEWPTALWFSTLVAAAGRCAGGGALVAVVDRPPTSDTIGYAARVTVAEGVTNVVRSLAASEAERSVRVNAVVATLPDEQASGAVRLLLSDDAAGLTGTALWAAGNTHER
jgi:hypothetical protein